MKSEGVEQLEIGNLVTKASVRKTVILNKDRFVSFLDDITSINNLVLFKNKIVTLKNVIEHPTKDRFSILNIDGDGDTFSLRKDILFSELNQIIEAQTLERANYYLKRLKSGIQEKKTTKVNDINLSRWKEYDNILTDSLWLFDKRDASGAHLGWYWGNFIPQIPRQLMLRYTKKGDWVLDTFAGSGTTLIECRRLGRNGIGIELNPEIALKAKELINKENNKQKVTTEMVVADSKAVDLKAVSHKHTIDKFQLLIMHPPYHDIIKFSEDENDLSNVETTEKFLEMFGKVIDNVTPYLEKGRYFALVIGDKYSKGEWIPLGFYCMNEVLKRSYLLKSIIVKNFEETKGKRNQKELWRYRALVGGFYIFKHEYIMIFKKR